MFRDSMNWCGYNINQVKSYFDRYIPQECDMYLLEGDSVDDTYHWLDCYRKFHKPQGGRTPEVHLFKHDLKSEFAGSVDIPGRMKNLANSANLLLSKIPLDDYDYVLWVESDIITPLNYIANMIKYIEESDYDMLSSLSWININKIETVFYDTWGFIGSNDKNYSNFKYDDFYRIVNRNKFEEMKSIGTVALIKTKVLKTKIDGKPLNFGDGAFQQLCSDARRAEFKVGFVTEKNVNVWHPSIYGHINNRWI